MEDSAEPQAQGVVQGGSDKPKAARVPGTPHPGREKNTSRSPRRTGGKGNSGDEKEPSTAEELGLEGPKASAFVAGGAAASGHQQEEEDPYIPQQGWYLEVPRTRGQQEAQLLHSQHHQLVLIPKMVLQFGQQ